MAFGYKVPTFNLWGRIWRVWSSGLLIADRYYLGPYYTRCSIARDINLFTMQVNFPKHSYLRSQQMTAFNQGDIFQVAGWDYMYGWIESVFDVGAGFPNEHRMARVYWPFDITPFNDEGFYTPAASTELEPPEGAEMLQLVLPADGWTIPNEVLNFPPP